MTKQEELEATWAAELKEAQTAPRFLTRVQESLFDQEHCCICNKKTEHWLMPENAPLCPLCLPKYLLDPRIYDPRGLHVGFARATPESIGETSSGKKIPATAGKVPINDAFSEIAARYLGWTQADHIEAKRAHAEVKNGPLAGSSRDMVFFHGEMSLNPGKVDDDKYNMYALRHARAARLKATQAYRDLSQKAVAATQRRERAPDMFDANREEEEAHRSALRQALVCEDEVAAKKHRNALMRFAL